MPSLRADRPKARPSSPPCPRLHTVGVGVKLGGLLRRQRRAHRRAPDYAFEHESYWPGVSGDRGRRRCSRRPAVGRRGARGCRELVTMLGLDERSGSLPRWAAAGTVLVAPRQLDRHVVDSWRYRVEWAPLPAGIASVRGTWLLATCGADAGDQDVAEALASHGASVRRLDVDETCVDREVLAERLTGAAAGLEDGELAGVLSLVGLAESPELAGMPVGLALTISMVRALGDAGIDAPLWTLTRGAVSTGRHDPVRCPAQAMILGTRSGRRAGVPAVVGRPGRPARRGPTGSRRSSWRVCWPEPVVKTRSRSVRPGCAAGGSCGTRLPATGPRPSSPYGHCPGDGGVRAPRR